MINLVCSNCTFMELKSAITNVMNLLECSNCTFMELKSDKLVWVQYTWIWF